MHHIGVIGFGAIGQSLLSILKDQPNPPAQVSVLLRAGGQNIAQDPCAADTMQVTACSDFQALLSGNPDLIVECAGHQALTQYGPLVLEARIDLLVASVGALADQALLDRMQAAAQKGRAQIILPAGAIGGIDALAAARLSGIQSVIYTGRKPPNAWAGTPAEAYTDLASLTQAVTFFDGSAREAALHFPKNANVAATLALAGIGMDATKVRLVADPGTIENTHEFSVRSNALDFEMRLIGKPSPLNPKTSASTAYSLARAVLNRSASIVI